MGSHVEGHVTCTSSGALLEPPLAKYEGKTLIPEPNISTNHLFLNATTNASENASISHNRRKLSVLGIPWISKNVTLSEVVVRVMEFPFQLNCILLRQRRAFCHKKSYGQFQLVRIAE
jgi:hypothetical protein